MNPYRASIASIIAQLFAAFPHVEATIETIAVYDRLLRHIPPADLQAIVDQCIVECKFFPTVAEIMDRYRTATHDVSLPTAGEGWEEVTRAFWAEGYTGRPNFSPITARVVASIGWRELCLSENQMADRAHFMRMYEQIVERDEWERRLLPQTKALVERHREPGGLTNLRALLSDVKYTR